jgi:heat shock protein HslJ
MIHSISTRLALVAALVLTVPAATTAQQPPLEGVDWQLVQYRDGSEIRPVPWFVDASLVLEAGEATGWGGCNGFTAAYEQDAKSLGLESRISTLVGCAEPVLAVERAYLAALADIATWDVVTVGEPQRLVLRDADGDDLLVFETPALSLTRSDIRALASEIEDLRSRAERHEQRIDDIRIGTLRDRIKALEAAAARSAGPDLSAFTEAERVLLSGVREDIAETCEPRRSQNPGGTIAALQCRPDTPAVADMAYYLMEQPDADRVWTQRMKQNKVKDGTRNRACAFDRPSMMFWVGGGLSVAGCYRNDDGRANLRFVTPATECRQLTAGATQVKNPSVYIAVLGPDRDIGSLYQWAASSTEWEHGEDLLRPLKQPGQPWSEQCPR